MNAPSVRPAPAVRDRLLGLLLWWAFVAALFGLVSYAITGPAEEVWDQAWALGLAVMALVYRRRWLAERRHWRWEG